MRVLIVGGYGTFGGRIAVLLEDEPSLTLVIAGRSLSAARRFCASRVRAKAALVAASFDRADHAAQQLAALGPDVLIDASGPFQAYGAAPYALVEACIAQRVNYLDLADASDFVAGAGAYNDAARAAGVYVLSGVSSFPVLTAAVVRRLKQGVARLDTISGGIAPSPYAGVGENVIRAVASYAGQPVAYLGRTAKVIGRPFTQQRRVTIAPPGTLPLKSLMFSLVDVPDLRALSQLWPETRRVWMGVAPVPEVLHRALVACAWLVAFGLARTLSPLARIMHWFTNRVRWGEHRGGMFIEITGADADGVAVRRSWHMVAEGDDGPMIPSMAAEAILRNHISGRAPAIGARAATNELELEDYERLFATRAIVTGVRSHDREALYPALLQSAYDAMPPAIREMHDGRDGAVAEGVGSVERGRNPLALFVGLIMRFPPQMRDADVRVEFRVDGAHETWRRTFGGHCFSSQQYLGSSRSSGLLCERFGPLEFAMALVREGDRLRLVLRRWRAFGIALPLWLAPRSEAYEAEQDGVFRFHVEISHPLTGLIVRYRGWLKRLSSTDP